jgi:putative nucleotidyltransferase with HDIG domain
MSYSDVTTRFWWLAKALLFAGAVVVAAQLSRAPQWHPLALVGLLLALALIGDRVSTPLGSGVLTTAHTAMVLAICLLGPGPAVFFAVAAAVVTSAVRRLSFSDWLANLATFTLYALAGSLLVEAVIGNVHDPANAHLVRSVSFALLVFAVSLLTISINFGLVALDSRIDAGHSVRGQFREAFLPLMPGHLAAAALAAILAVGYTNLGLPVLVCAIIVLGIFHYLTTALLRSEERADQLEARSIHLANMQLGVLSMLMEALALRDRTSSLHATTVARYAKALAIEVGCEEAEQETIHTAALLHDIGKFAWSDRVLHPTDLTDADWAVIRRHPQDGAALVGKLDGYGPVAEAILYHHERVDGGGYPAGLIGPEIPLASRIIAVCSTYDTMTTRSTYGPPMTSPEALAELGKIAGGQLEGELVEKFAAMVERDGPIVVDGEANAAYEAEMDFEQRVRRMALPVPGRPSGGS